MIQIDNILWKNKQVDDYVKCNKLQIDKISDDIRCIINECYCINIFAYKFSEHVLYNYLLDQVNCDSQIKTDKVKDIEQSYFEKKDNRSDWFWYKISSQYLDKLTHKESKTYIGKRYINDSKACCRY